MIGSLKKLNFTACLAFTLIILASIAVSSTINALFTKITRKQLDILLVIQPAVSLSMLVILALYLNIYLKPIRDFIKKSAGDTLIIRNRLEHLPFSLSIIVIIFNVVRSLSIRTILFFLVNLTVEQYVIETVVAIITSVFFALVLYSFLYYLVKRYLDSLHPGDPLYLAGAFSANVGKNVAIINAASIFFPIIVLLLSLFFYDFNAETFSIRFSPFVLLGLVLGAFFIVFQYLNNLVLFNRYSASPSELELEEDNLKKYRITDREKEVIFYIMHGLSNKEISEKINVSVKTVKNHVYNIFQKTGAKNKIKLIQILKK